MPAAKQNFAGMAMLCTHDLTEAVSACTRQAQD